MKGRETGVKEVTKRNGLPQAKLAEIDDAIMGISEALREARTLTRSTDPVVLAATVKLIDTLHQVTTTLQEIRRG